MIVFSFVITCVYTRSRTGCADTAILQHRLGEALGLHAEFLSALWCMTLHTLHSSNCHIAVGGLHQLRSLAPLPVLQYDTDLHHQFGYSVLSAQPRNSALDYSKRAT